ncbi:MAG: hypothetical protein JF563_06625, partial [Acidobacteriales bacterium]|nr:hypothetical protein [Terriglobales bacterium]
MTKLFLRTALALVGVVLLITGIIVFTPPRAFSRPADQMSEADLLEGYRHVEVASVSDAIEKLTGRRMYLSHR